MYINKKRHTSSRFTRLRAVLKLSTFLYTLYMKPAKTSSMARWNVAGAVARPKGIGLNSYV